MTEQYVTPVFKMNVWQKGDAEKQAKIFGKDVVDSPFVCLVKYPRSSWAVEFENGEYAQVVKFPPRDGEELPEIGVIWGEWGKPSEELITRPSDNKVFEMHPDWSF